MQLRQTCVLASSSLLQSIQDDQLEEIVLKFTGYLEEQFQNQVELKGTHDALQSQIEQQ